MGLTAPIAGLHTVQRIRRGAWVHATTPRPPVGLTPHSVVHRHDKLTVRHYPAAPSTDRLLPVVLVPSLINKAYILDLEPGRSLVEWLSAKGHPVYLVDWGTPGDEDADEDVGYVLLELLHRSITRACRHAGTQQCVLFGYCMGGTLAAMYTALRPRHVASLVVLNAPFKFSEGGRFRQLADPAHLDAEAAIRDDALLSVEVMKPAFKLLDPMGNWTKFLGVEAAADDPRRLAQVLARERWLEENVPLTGAFAREFITCAYQQDR
ncbi:MAG: polyhydroxyalkanoate synthase, partial [Myxococcota bacterium]